jgi:hypothetical protein
MLGTKIGELVIINPNLIIEVQNFNDQEFN